MIFEVYFLHECRAGHLSVLSLPESSWYFRSYLFRVMMTQPLLVSGGEFDHEVMKVRVEGSRTVRDLWVSSGEGSFQRLHPTFWRLRRKHNETFGDISWQFVTITPGSVLDFGSLHQEPRGEQVQKVAIMHS